jgi:hypothetical protein
MNTPLLSLSLEPVTVVLAVVLAALVVVESAATAPLTADNLGALVS